MGKFLQVKAAGKKGGSGRKKYESGEFPVEKAAGKKWQSNVWEETGMNFFTFPAAAAFFSCR